MNPNEKYTFDLLRPLPKLKLWQVIDHMLRYGKPCRVLLRGGLRLTYAPGQYFAISRQGKPPSAQEIAITCREAALAAQPPMLNEVLLFTGPTSAGKTEMASRVGQVMQLPFTMYAGTAVRNASQMAVAMERAAVAHELRVQRIEDRGGMPAYRLPPMIVGIDEAHEINERMQQALLTAFAANDRTLVIQRDRADVVFDVSQVGFILCTTPLQYPNQGLARFRQTRRLHYL